MNSWITLPLGELCRFKAGSAFPQDEQGSTSGAYPFVKVSDLSSSANSKFLNSANNWISADQAASLRPTIAPEGAVLFAKIGEGLRSERCRVATRATAYDNNLMSAVALEKTCDPGFLFYLMQVVGLSDYAEGSALPYLKQSVLQKIPCTVPAVIEQRAIAEVLGALDDKIAANSKLAQTSMELSEEIYRHGTASFPECPMNEVLTPILGGTPSRSRTEFWNGDVLWASAKDVTGADNGVITDTEERITGAAASQTKAKPLPACSVILTARGTVGAVARLATPASFNQSCYGFIPGDLPPGMLYFGILGAAKRAKSIAHGSVFDTITMKTFAHLPLPDMSASEIANLESFISPLLDLVVETVKENRTLAATRDALLPQMMSGKLRVKDIEHTMGEMV